MTKHVDGSTEGIVHHHHHKKTDGKGMDLDEVLPVVGEFGKYQKLLLFLVCLPACVPCGFCAFSQLFMSNIPDHWCRVPQLEHLSRDERRRMAIPTLTTSDNSTKFDPCQRYAINWTDLLQYTQAVVHEVGAVTSNLSWIEETRNGKTNGSSWDLEYCLDGWEYDVTSPNTSIVVDFNLVCDKDIYPTIGLAALNTGGPVGVYFFGLLNDRLGRKLSFFLCLATLVGGSLASAMTQNFWQWAASRVVVGLTIPAIYQIPFIISLELVGPNYRSAVTVMTCLFYSMGLLFLSVVAYYIRNWIYLTYATSAPFLLYFLYWWVLPESPRWLLAKGRLEEASKILETLARVNGKELPDSFKLQLKQGMMLKRTVSEEQRLKKGPGVASLCRTPNMRLKTTLITLNWFASSMVYVGLSYYGPALGNNEYFSFFLSTLVELPSYLVCLVVMDRIGRRWPLCIGMIVSGISCIITVTLPHDAVVATLVLFLFSKFAISAPFLVIYPFAGELYPTSLRGVGIGTSAYIGGLGLIIIPFITYLGQDNLRMPLVIMGIISVFGGLTGLRLPETLHQKLPQTVEEGEEFGKDWSIKELLHCIPPGRPSSVEGSYEDLSQKDEADEVIEMLPQRQPSEKDFLSRKSRQPSDKDLLNRRSRLVRQQSTMETPVDNSGVVKMTYWF
uniref:Organic cation transporter 1 n=1 Tax=Cacopsylla melanoneura TaxID=428564 RepID=A0A8D9BIE8_9HEMI